MIWADRVAVVWAVVVYAVVFFFLPPHADTAGELAFRLGAFVVLPAWLLMRGLDWIFSGTWRWHPTPQRGK